MVSHRNSAPVKLSKFPVTTYVMKLTKHICVSGARVRPTFCKVYQRRLCVILLTLAWYVSSFKEKIRREDSEASIPTKNTDNLDLSIDVGLIMVSINSTMVIFIDAWWAKISLSIDLVNYGVNAEVYFKAIVNIRIAKASGSLKGGSTLTLGLSNILDGTLMFRIEDEDVVLYYGFHAFENVSNNRAVVLHLPDAKKGESLEVRFEIIRCLITSWLVLQTKILDVFLPSEKQTWKYYVRCPCTNTIIPRQLSRSLSYFGVYVFCLCIVGTQDIAPKNEFRLVDLSVCRYCACSTLMRLACIHLSKDLDANTSALTTRLFGACYLPHRYPAIPTTWETKILLSDAQILWYGNVLNSIFDHNFIRHPGPLIGIDLWFEDHTIYYDRQWFARPKY